MATAADGLLVLVLAAGSLAMLAAAVRTDEAARDVEVVAGARLTAVLPLGKSGVHQVQGVLGRSDFEIRGGKVAMRSSPCPDGLCVRQGWRSRAGDMVVCAPNGVALVLRGGSSVDVIAH